MRTTLDIAKPVLDRLKVLQRKEGQTLSQVASSLLAEALSRHESASSGRQTPRLEWTCVDMKARVDIADKDALYQALDPS